MAERFSKRIGANSRLICLPEKNLQKAGSRLNVRCSVGPCNLEENASLYVTAIRECVADFCDFKTASKLKIDCTYGDVEPRSCASGAFPLTSRWLKGMTG
jgi:hypothetical protein